MEAAIGRTSRICATKILPLHCTVVNTCVGVVTNNEINDPAR